ncbi:hypothetical protein ACE7GA_24860 [Roseomonas sp. CCTCC AB2023176]|uniref:FliH/SctL family protein n=1 Tax=Roseomonas sp. CCTCC AB2023176 TaxID=3342640 RepID=UPI0035DD9335
MGALLPLRALRLPDLDAPAAPLPPPEPTLEERIAAARAEGFAAGLVEGEARGRAAAETGRAAMAEESIRLALLTMEDLRAEAVAAVEENARALGELLFAAFDAALPGAAARHAPQMLPRLLEALGPVEEAPSGATLRVPPAILDLARERFGDRGLPIEPDPSLPEGDARIAWRDGAVALVLEDRRREIREVLASLDLLPKDTA